MILGSAAQGIALFGMQCNLHIWTTWVTHLDDSRNYARDEWDTRDIDITGHGMISAKWYVVVTYSAKNQRVNMEY